MKMNNEFSYEWETKNTVTDKDLSEEFYFTESVILKSILR